MAVLTVKDVLWGFERREAETEFAGEWPSRVFLLERKSPCVLMRQLRCFRNKRWSLLRTIKQMFEFTDGSHQKRFWEEPRERCF